ncbi:uncharacterized protein BO96DRAFT_436920 [Aspergillus niger CBS 101883]|uniref:uncharacterized protein n=1 Tax=Aspergillus lacticoffeatus (strain CBS 101883) TaxID=1450533 RepID=UPI000D7F5F25|nr:uncharacterized protein BO96DRAFT_436920 [Aspergillus niger CBS 101883]PYH53630.1 hypothetical protein BO96DRAFT_436920 [Aspergillus niger CBS 101883]RDH20772.1 hypothetical protein M747DRAFT_314874 [Aspergillus niger ATCC 13496]
MVAERTDIRLAAVLGPAGIRCSRHRIFSEYCPETPDAGPFCLAIFVDHIMVRFYSKQSQRGKEDCLVQGQLQKLRQWAAHSATADIDGTSPSVGILSYMGSIQAINVGDGLLALASLDGFLNSLIYATASTTSSSIWDIP